MEFEELKRVQTLSDVLTKDSVKCAAQMRGL